MLNLTKSFLDSLEEIKSQIDKTEKYILEDHDYFQEQVNFFTKSIIISICTHFEAFTKEIVKFTINHYSNKLKVIQIPSNLLLWDIEKNNYKEKDRDSKKNHSLTINNDDIDYILSANPYRVKNALLRCGIDLDLSSIFKDNIHIINSFVEKRNQIIHYNHGVSDISLGDLKYHLNSIFLVIIEIDKSARERFKN